MFLFIAAAIFLSAGSCMVIHPVTGRHSPRFVQRQQVPPGQMKKMTGEKSAKAYAPGQQKKKRK